MGKTKVLVSGASVAGPSVALWLARYGFDVTVVERARALRPGGFAVDFRGRPHLAVLERMGVLDDLRARRTHMRGSEYVDAEGRLEFGLPASMLSGELEIERGELARVLYEHTRQRVTYRFGDSIAALYDMGSHVDVAFESGPSERYDLVIGADGLHSNVRRLVFGPESKFLKYNGYYVAGGFDVPNRLGLSHLTRTHSAPGRSLTLSSDADPEHANALLVWHAPEPPAVGHHDVEAQKRVLREAFAGMGWEVPGVLAELDKAERLYFDSFSVVKLDESSRGRVVLLGDAAFGATMGGMGTGLAVVSAYVLASELALANGDHARAFARYDALVRPYALGTQAIADGAGPFLAPRTRRGMWARRLFYRLMSWGPLSRRFDRMTVRAAEAIELPDYRVEQPLTTV